MEIGSLVRYGRCVGIVTHKKEYPTGLTRNLVRWSSGEIDPGLWINSEDLELLSEGR